MVRKKDGSLIRKTRSMERKLAGSNAKLCARYENYICIPRTFLSRRGKNSSRIFDNALTDFEEEGSLPLDGKERDLIKFLTFPLTFYTQTNVAATATEPIALYHISSDVD